MIKDNDIIRLIYVRKSEKCYWSDERGMDACVLTLILTVSIVIDSICLFVI